MYTLLTGYSSWRFLITLKLEPELQACIIVTGLIWPWGLKPELPVY